MAEEIVPVEIKELAHWSMFADAPGVENRKSRLAWAVRDGQPRITVYTNIPSDTTGKGMISAFTNPATFNIFLSELERIAQHGNPGEKAQWECHAMFKQQNGGVAEKTLISKVIYGKDDNGIVWMAITAANRPQIKFEFLLDDLHHFSKADGTPYTAAEGSRLRALSVVFNLKHIYANLAGGFRERKAANPNFNSNRAPAPSSGMDTAPMFSDDINF